MGKISGLPDLERLEIIGYLAQEGVIDKITAEVPLRKCAEFENKYGVKPYPINSNKKFSEQLRIYLSDPESAPPLLKAALDPSQPRLNDSPFVRELVENYGFSFFGKQNSQSILQHAKGLGSDAYEAFITGYSSNSKFISDLTNSVQTLILPDPIASVIDPQPPLSRSKKQGSSKKSSHIDPNESFSEQQLLYLGWAGEEYLYKYLSKKTEEALSLFSIDASSVEDIEWFNKGYEALDKPKDRSVGKGCDIVVKTKDKDCHIEVKSSRRLSPIFGMTSQEMQQMKSLRNSYYLAKIDYLENIIAGEAPRLRVFRDPYAHFFDPIRMQKAIFFCG